MSSIIDISLPLSSDLTRWPGSIGFTLTRTLSLENGDNVNNSKLICDVHIGTHVDAPCHYLNNGSGSDKIDLDRLVGPALVVSVLDKEFIDENVLNDLCIPKDTKRLLLRTQNSFLWDSIPHEFTTKYVALTQGAAQWLLDSGIFLIGIDYLSIQIYNDKSRTHEILLESGVVILEGLNLSHVETGMYELICLPLKIIGSDGSPSRAILRQLNK